jgi:hypothetical protein
MGTVTEFHEVDDEPSATTSPRRRLATTLRIALYVAALFFLWRTLSPHQSTTADTGESPIWFMYSATAFIGAVLLTGLAALIVEASLRMVRK